MLWYSIGGSDGGGDDIDGDGESGGGN